MHSCIIDEVNKIVAIAYGTAVNQNACKMKATLNYNRLITDLNKVIKWRQDFFNDPGEQYHPLCSPKFDAQIF